MNFLPSNPPEPVDPREANSRGKARDKDALPKPPADPNKSFGQVVREMARDAETRKNKIIHHSQQKLTNRENQQADSQSQNQSGEQPDLNSESHTDTPPADRRQNPGHIRNRRDDSLKDSIDEKPQSPSPADRRVPQLPVISPRAFSLATWRASRSLGKQFSAVRISKRGLAPTTEELPDKPVLIYCNHPSIWTASLGLFLASKCWPTWRHYAPAEPANISTYALTRKIGLFPVPEGKNGRLPLMRTARNVLYCPGHMLWLPATLAPADPRLRPMPIHNAIAHLARKFDDIVILPLAIEHPYRAAPLPEALIRFGTPFQTLDAGRRSLEGWQNLLQRRLQMVMDRLSEESADPHPEEFENLM